VVLKFSLSLLILLICPLAGLSAKEEHWPQFRGPNSLGVSENTNLPDTWSRTKNVLWKQELPGRGWSSPVVWGNRVFITTVINAGMSEEPQKGLYFGGNRQTPSTTEHEWKVYCLDLKTGDVAWERITYFLERVIPVCEEYKVRAACHPHDPGMPPEGFQGIARVLGTVDGLKKFISIQESPFHGLNLCIGTTAEMLHDPASEIHDVIRYFGQRKKIFNIHFRNIRGKRDDFQEVYMDNGDMNMFEVIRTLHEVDYQYMVMADHVPRHPDDPGGRQAYAFTYGYIKALLQAVANQG
jgi:hypothetical protein